MIIQIQASTLRSMSAHVQQGIGNDPRSAKLSLDFNTVASDSCLLAMRVEGVTAYRAIHLTKAAAMRNPEFGAVLNAKIFCDYVKKLKGEGLVQLIVPEDMRLPVTINFKGSFVELSRMIWLRKAPGVSLEPEIKPIIMTVDSLHGVLQALSGVKSGDEELASEFTRVQLGICMGEIEFYAQTRYRMILASTVRADPNQTISFRSALTNVELDHLMKVLKCIKIDVKNSGANKVGMIFNERSMEVRWTIGDGDKVADLIISMPTLNVEDFKYDYHKLIEPINYGSRISVPGARMREAYNRLDQIARSDPEQGHRMELITYAGKLYMLATGAGVGIARESIDVGSCSEFNIAVNGSKLVEMFRAVKQEKLEVGLAKSSVHVWWEQEFGEDKFSFKLRIAGMRPREGVMEMIKGLSAGSGGARR